ncbi:MAG: alkaline phosphatase family protein [Deltaproteobacteria bacterium]|nr:alkaline phosphatase family protein [Deltaproteobacteria bacterium]
MTKNFLPKKLLVVQAAALSHPPGVFGFLRSGLMETVFPAVTCTASASFRTGLAPSEHGIVGNGHFFKALSRPMFWEQSARLINGPRIWEDFRKNGGKVGMFFWQQSLGEALDMVLSPAPIHKHHGGMIEACAAKPADLYDRVTKAVGRPFRLRHYWGPLASAKAGDWIAEAVSWIMAQKDLAPDLCLCYLPTLDYDLQRFDPKGPAARKAARFLDSQLSMLMDAAEAKGYDVVVFGDYAIAPVSGAVYPNRVLYDSGLFATRSVKGMLYPNFHESRAFAVVDHQIAHVYVQNAADLAETARLLSNLEGVKSVFDKNAQKEAGIAHENSGDLVLVSTSDKWFAYPWWTDKGEAPDYATHVDIHQKPGYDPCELFFGWPPVSVGQNPGRIRGSHGIAGPNRKVFWGSTISFPKDPEDLLELAAMVREHLKQI